MSGLQVEGGTFDIESALVRIRALYPTATTGHNQTETGYEVWAKVDRSAIGFAWGKTLTDAFTNLVELLVRKADA
jgi:hypothetical protein